jgi:small GTP-binding protein
MDGVTRRAALMRALEELAALAPQAQRARAAELARRLREDRLRVLVVGEAKRGKSTVVNALLGRAVLPTGVTPLTAVATTVTHARREQVRVLTRDGRWEQYPLAALGDLVTEAGNPHNRRGLAQVVVHVDVPLLAEGIELVDTPGTGSVFAHNTATAEQALDAMDAAIFVLSVDPPISDAERVLLERVRDASVATFVVLNKIDRLDPAERAEALAFTTQVVGPASRVYPCSARAALARLSGHVEDHAPQAGADADGFGSFATHFTDYLRRDRSRALERSLSRQGADLAGLLRDQVRVTRRADQLRGGAHAARAEAFRVRLDTAEQRRREAGDLATAEAGHLLADLNTSAQHAITTITPQVLNRLDHVLSEQSAGGALRRIYEQGREASERSTGELVEAWRTQQAASLRRRLAALDRRLGEQLERDLAQVRDAARDLLGVELTAPAGRVSLITDPRFHYAPPAPEGPTEVLAAALRRRLPGRLGRTRARRFLREQAAQLLDQMVGRARADLQYRLAQTTAALTSTLTERYAQYTAHLSQALDAAQRLREAGQAQGAQLRAELDTRERALDELLARLRGLDPEPQREPTTRAAPAGHAV